MKVLTWVLFNSVFLAALIAGFHFEYENAQNLIYFGVPFITIISLFLFNKKVRKECAKEKRSVPYFVDVSYDIAFTFALAFYGQFFMATLYAFHILGLGALEHERQEKP